MKDFAADSVQEVMTKKVVSVNPETPLLSAIDILVQHKLNGLPVVDHNKILVGILTEYDMITTGSEIHLPTFFKLLKGFEVYKKDSSLIGGDMRKILKMQVKDAMNTDPLTLPEDATIEEAARAFGEHHRVNPIPIVTADHTLIGVLSRHDFLRLFGRSFPNHMFRKRQLDQNVDKLLKNFEKEFILVSRFRTKTWLLFSILFTIVGFIIAFALIIRINR